MRYADELEESLLEQKRRLLRAIRDRSEERVDEGLQVYRRLIERFLERTNQYRLRYGRDQAEREGTPFASITGWEVIDWIRSDYHSFVEEVFREGYRPALFSVLHFPFSLAAIAVGKRDYFIFQKFILEPGSFPYSLTYQLEDEKLRELVVAKFAAFTRDFVRYHLRQVADDVVEVDELGFVAEVGEGVCSYLNDLMKEAIESDRIEDFKKFRKRLEALWSESFWQIDGHDGWKRWNRALDDPQMIKRFGEAEHALHVAFQQVTQDLRERARLIRFGLVGWVLGDFAGGDRETEKTRNWLSACGGMGSLRQVLETYADALSYETQERLGWSRWVMDTMPRDRVVTIDPSSFLHYVPVYYGMQIDLRDEDREVLPADIKKARRLSFAVKDGGLSATVSALSEDEEQAGRWEDLLESNVDVVQDTLSDLLDRIRREYEQKWETVVRAADVSNEKVEEFRGGIVSGFERNCRLQRLFRSGDQWREYEEDDETYRQERWIGYHLRLDKELFVEDSPATVRSFGERYGEGIARSEARRVLERIRGGELPTRNLEEVDDPLIELEEQLSRLKREGRNRLGVLLVQGWPIYRRLELEDLLDNRGSDSFGDDVPYIGTFKDVPVFRVHVGDHNGALVAQLADLGEWQRYLPYVREEDQDLILNDYMRFSVQEIDEEAADRMVAQARDVNGEEPELTVEELLLQVRFRLFSRVEWEWDDPEAGIWLDTPREME